MIVPNGKKILLAHLLVFFTVASISLLLRLPEYSNIAFVNSAARLHVVSDLPETGTNPGQAYETIFLTASGKKNKPDLFYANVWFGSSGKPYRAANIKNMSRSPDGDDYLLEFDAPYAVMATRLSNRVSSLTIWDFSRGIVKGENGWNAVLRLLAGLSNYFETGRFAGVFKKTVRFDYPPGDVKIKILKDEKNARVKVLLSDHLKKKHTVFIDLKKDKNPPDGFRESIHTRLPKNPVLWLVDTVRSIKAIGPGPIEWLEGRYFALHDATRRFLYKFESEEKDEPDSDFSDSQETTIIKLVPGKEVGANPSKGTWPPNPLSPPVFSRLRHSEGKWNSADPDFYKSDMPPLVYRTYIRPDRERPYVRVQLLAMDMRRLDLHMVAGVEDPLPSTGTGGDGRIPRRPELLNKIVAAFNGAFKSEHGNYGMMVERNVLLPPKDGAATIASMKDGRTLMGTWPDGKSIPDNMISFRQNMVPLVENQVVNPKRQYLWGFTLSEDFTRMNTIRSGICMTDSGYLIYVWGEDLTATTLGVAMNAAKCNYGMHLDMNPYHTAFIFYRFMDDPKTKVVEFESELPIPEMLYSANRYIYGAPKDFFFVTRKKILPGEGWEFENLAQPAPADIPAVFHKKKGSSHFLMVRTDRTAINLGFFDVPPTLYPPGLKDKNSNKINPENSLVQLNLSGYGMTTGRMINGTIISSGLDDKEALGITNKGNLISGSWKELIKSKDILDVIQTEINLEDLKNNKQTFIGFSTLKKDWLKIIWGPGQHIYELQQKEKSGDFVFFNADEKNEKVVRRTTSGWVDSKGDKVKSFTAGEILFDIAAAPKKLGITKLKF